MRWVVILLVLLFFVGIVSAHGIEEVEEIHATQNLINPSDVLIYSTIIIGAVVLLSVLFQNRLGGKMKKLAFILIVLPVIVSTVYLTGHTIYLNTISESGGPVHWHADFQLWVCGERVTLPGPEGFFDNKVGTGVFHHHADDRIHVEGILIKKQDADLSRFFGVIGGSLASESIGIPQKDGNVKTWVNGDLCNGETGKLKVYVNGRMHREMGEYVISPYEQVPPGDCIIIDFSTGEPETTDKVCESLEGRGGYRVYEEH